MPCAEAPRNCIWVTSMGQAIRRYDQTQWTTPDGLAMKLPKGILDVAFDGQTLIVGKRHWPLSGVTNLAPPEWNGGAPIDPENLEDVTVWRHGTSVCLDMQYVSSGKGDRYTEVLLLHRQRLHALPPLFGTCAAIREAPQNQFSYPNNTYQGPSRKTTQVACKWITCCLTARREWPVICCASQIGAIPFCFANSRSQSNVRVAVRLCLAIEGLGQNPIVAGLTALKLNLLCRGRRRLPDRIREPLEISHAATRPLRNGTVTINLHF